MHSNALKLSSRGSIDLCFVYRELTLTMHCNPSARIAQSEAPIPWHMFPASLVSNVQNIIVSSKKKGELVSAWENIKILLISNSLAEENARMTVDTVGTHRGNRSKRGLSGGGAHSHGADILSDGFSWTKAADATSIEAPPEPLLSEAMKF